MEVPSHIKPPDGIEFRESEMVPTQMGKIAAPGGIELRDWNSANEYVVMATNL